MKPSVKFWLLTLPLNPVLRLAILKTIWRRRRKKRVNNNNKNSSKPQQKLKHRVQQVANYQPGDRLKEETQIFILLLFQQKV
jgi:cytochrome c-type biogenesis protein CcmH/NrfF